jgi:hypothetical protein
MAGGPPLTPPARRRLLAIVAAVLLGHAVALHWASSHLQWQVSLLKPMTEPMYTRVLAPQEPPPVPALAAAPAPEPPPAPRRMRAAPSVPRTATPTMAEAQPAPEPPPQQTEEPVAAGPAEPASAPPAAEPAQETTAQAPEPAASTPAASAPGTGTPTTVAGADPAGWPPDTRLRYRLGGRFRSGQLYGDARVLWQRDAQRYQVRVEVDVTFMASLVMTSQGEVGGGTLLPQAYEEVRNGKPRGLRVGESEVMLANGNVVPRPQGLQDTASQFVELSHRFATGREQLEVGRAVSFWMARPGAVDLWTYDVVEREMLRTPLGEIEAFHLKPRPIANPRGNITAEMWFAPSLQHLPVRIRVSMGEEAQIDLLVEAIDQR